MAPRTRKQPDPPVEDDDPLDDLSDDELEEYLERRKQKRESAPSRSDRVTILEGSHARDWLAAFGIGSNKEDEGSKRRGYFGDGR